MIYKETLIKAMDILNQNENTRFIGYNLKYGSKGYGTLSKVNQSKIIEMPVAEALMSGMATGMSLLGFIPVLIFERHDFIFIALDQLVNHLDKIQEYSHGEFIPKVIIRAVVGSISPFDPGIQHKADYTEILRKLFHFEVINLYSKFLILPSFSKALHSKTSTLLIEYRQMYEGEA